jgi:hypothetical protein
MAGFFTESEQRRRQIAIGATILLLVVAIAIALRPRSVESLTGLRSAPELASPDDLPVLASADATPFFRERDQVEIRVAEATTLRQFLDRNRLNKPYTRRQIEEQLGNASPDAPIAAGTVFRLRLTPVVEDVPGAAPDTAR